MTITPERRAELRAMLRAEANSIEHQVRGQDQSEWKEIGLMREAADALDEADARIATMERLRQWKRIDLEAQVASLTKALDACVERERGKPAV